MKKILLFVILLTSLLSCSVAKVDPNFKWYNTRNILEYKDQFRPGDIIILSRGNKFHERWGHSAIINNEYKIVEFPGYSEGYQEVPIEIWSNLNRNFSILRLKNIDDEFIKELHKEIDNTINKEYGLTLDKDYYKRLYCSQFVYSVFKLAGIDVNRDIDLDSNGGVWVMPFDILKSSELENIILN